MVDINLKGIGWFLIIGVFVSWLLIPSKRMYQHKQEYKTYVVKGKEYVCPKKASFNEKTLECSISVCPVGYKWNLDHCEKR